MFIHVSASLSPITAIKALFVKGANPKDARIKYFSFSRGALITAVESLRHKYRISNPLVMWLPAFICDTVPIILKEYSIECRYYRVNSDLSPDLESLEGERFEENNFFLLVHYFGFLIPQQPIIDLCNKRKMLLIEDCAHSIVRDIGAGKIGTMGEAGIFGLRKALPIPNGGALFLKACKLREPKTLFLLQSEYRHPIKMIVQWLCQSIGISWTKRKTLVDKNIYPKMSENYYFLNCNEDISWWSKKIISAIDIDYAIERRRKNFDMVHKFLSKFETIKIPLNANINDKDVVPWIFFFYHNESEKIINALIQAGISASTFPTLPAEIFNSEDWPLDNQMYRDGITLPIHQDISSKKMLKMLRTIERIVS